MKNILLLVVALSANAFAVDYGGADKYPVQSVTGGSYILMVNGVDIDPSYDLQAKAISAASLLSIKCGCLVSIRQPTIKYSTEWRVSVKSSSSSSSKSSAPSSAPSSSSSIKTMSYVEWARPTQRVDSSELRENEISNYILKQPESLVSIPPAQTRAVVDESKGLPVSIAVIDTLGNASDFINLNIKKGSI